MNSEDNAQNIELLKEIIRSPQNKAAVFVGAGASVPLGIRSWKDLLAEMAKEFRIDMAVDKCIMNRGYPETASELYNNINSDDKYLTFLRKQFEPTNCNFTSLHLKVIDTFRIIFTTNFDSSFENALTWKTTNNGSQFNVQKFPNFNPFTLSERQTVVYLHGNNDENKYIFRKEEYDLYYPSISGIAGSRELESFLKEILSIINVVFIGFSFNDKYFSSFAKNVMKELLEEQAIHRKCFNVNHPRKPVNHFVFLPNDGTSNIEEIKDIGLNVILYEKERHIEIENILDNIKITSAASIEEAAYAK